MLRSLFILVPLMLAAGCAHPLAPRGSVDAWRLGPFLEGVEDSGGNRMLAVRPFYSRETDVDDAFYSVTDILWPLGNIQRRGQHTLWRFFPFYGGRDEQVEPSASYRFRLLPIYFEGRTRDGEEYRALFPLGGSIDGLPMMGRVRFVLFPLYGRSDRNEVKTRTVLWPLYLRRQGPKVDQLRLFPFYGRRVDSRRQTETRRFVLWPFWTQYDVEGADIDDGHAWLLFPFYGRIQLENVEGWMLLPPFFSHVQGPDGFRRLYAPWPVIRVIDDRDRHERHWWPFYGRQESAGRSRWYSLWPLIRSSHEERKSTGIDRFHITPVYYSERRTQWETEGDRKVHAVTTRQYRRIWPLFSWSLRGEETRFRAPELSLFSDNASIERNWAPFWSFFVRRTYADGARVNDLFWGLCAWGRDGRDRGFLQLLWALRFGARVPFDPPEMDKPENEES